MSSIVARGATAALAGAWIVGCGDPTPAPSATGASASATTAVSQGTTDIGTSARAGGAAATQAPVAAPPCPTTMVHIAGATFEMGSPETEGDKDEHPKHTVSVDAFCMDRTEVTVGAYRACVANPRGEARCGAPETTVKWNGADVTFWSKLCTAGQANGDELPLNCVDWNQASAYCAWSGGRLPTEAEWELAARGKEGRTYPWGNAAPTAKHVNACGAECQKHGASLGKSWAAMHKEDDGFALIAPVGRFPGGATPEGALDMAGNLWEWTSDWYAGYPREKASNPRGPDRPGEDPRRVIRGGGWFSFAASRMRGAIRDRRAVTDRSDSVGIRCVRSPGA